MTGGAVQSGRWAGVNHGNQERVRDLGIISTGVCGIIQEEKKEEKGGPRKNPGIQVSQKMKRIWG